MKGGRQEADDERMARTENHLEGAGWYRSFDNSLSPGTPGRDHRYRVDPTAGHQPTPGVVAFAQVTSRWHHPDAPRGAASLLFPGTAAHQVLYPGSRRSDGPYAFNRLPAVGRSTDRSRTGTRTVGTRFIAS